MSTRGNLKLRLEELANSLGELARTATSFDEAYDAWREAGSP